MRIEQDIPRYDFKGTMGDGILRQLRVRSQQTDLPVNYTGADLRMQFRRNLADAAPVFDLNLGNGGLRLLEGGEVIEFYVAANDVTAALAIDNLSLRPGFPTVSLFYDLQAALPGQPRKTILRGLYIFTQEVTR